MPVFNSSLENDQKKHLHTPLHHLHITPHTSTPHYTTPTHTHSHSTLACHAEEVTGPAGDSWNPTHPHTTAFTLGKLMCHPHHKSAVLQTLISVIARGAVPLRYLCLGPSICAARHSGT